MPLAQSMPAVGSTSWYDWIASLDSEVRARALGVVQIDSFPGATDDAKHVAAWNYARSQTQKPILQYPARTFGPLSTPIAAFSGMRAIGPDGNDGVKNLELSSGNLVNHRVRVQAGTGTSALFVQSGTLQDIVFANIAFSGSASSQWWHNTNGDSQSIYPCQFHSLSFDGFLHVLGNASSKFTTTQGVFSGHWTVLNFSGTPLNLGGSDNSLWMAGYINLNSPASVAGAGRPLMHVDWMEKSDFGYLYCTAENGWSGVRIEGQNNRTINFYGGTFEGRAAGNPATYPVIDIRSGRAHFHGPRINYVIPGNAGGAVVQTGGYLTLDHPTYQKATSADDTFPLLYQSGGLARVIAPAAGNGTSPIRIRWKDAALGAQNHDIPAPTGNRIEAW